MKSILEKCFSPELLDFIYLKGQTLTFEKGETIFKQGDKVRGLYFVSKGKVKVTTLDGSNKHHLIRLASESDILGHRGLGGDGTYPITATALENSCEVFFIPIGMFNELAKSNAAFAYEMMTFFAQELRKSENFSMHLPASQRVSLAILSNFEAFGFDKESPGKLSYTLTRKDISSMAGTTYETTIRVLADLTKKKILRLDNKDIIISSMEKLKKHAYN